MLKRITVIKAVISVLILFVSCAYLSDDDTESIVYNDELLYVNTEYYSDGRVKSRQTFKEISSDSFIGHGYVYYYYPSGQIEYFSNINKGKKIGTAYTYFKNGDIKDVWFYNPGGNAISAIKYDSLGNVIEELSRDQRKPQVIMKNLDFDSVKITVYSMDIPYNEKNVYLSTSRHGTIDSIMRTEDQFDVFKIKKDTSLIEVSIDYIDMASGDILSSDYSQFRLND